MRARFPISKIFWLSLSLLLNGLRPAAAQTPVIIGKDEWLFYRPEMIQPADEAAINTSLDLVQRFNKTLSANGIALAYAVVPIKMRIYAEFLPDQVKLTPYMAANYERASKVLRAKGVNVVDVNTAMMKSPIRTSISPIFLKGDTHWSQLGSMVVAEAIKDEILLNPLLKKAYEATPEEKYTMDFRKKMYKLKGGDLRNGLPAEHPKYSPEQTLLFDVKQPKKAAAGLLDDTKVPEVVLVGSSYSQEWTLFSQALRFALQRDVLSFAVTADKSPWVGLIETYVASDSFQNQPPKLLIWETPERELAAPPNYIYREQRYKSDNTEWLLRVSAWVQRVCKASTVSTSIAKVGLAGKAQSLADDAIAVTTTTEAEFVEVRFSKPITKQQYVSARLTTEGSKLVNVEASGPGVATRRFTLNVVGDELEHNFRMPLPSPGAGYTTFKLYPGQTEKFSMKQLAVCDQPSDLLL
jgi:alginate O-acetyltransferase complex protein AlgJ